VGHDASAHPHQSQIIGFFLFLLLSFGLKAQPFDPFSAGNTTPSYSQIVGFYEKLHQQYPNITRWETLGPSDAGFPLRVFLIVPPLQEPLGKELSNLAPIRVLINNGIHPGEPEGINASMRLAQNVLSGRLKWKHGERFTLAIVPVYNIGGSLNRSAHSRANQNGPAEYGFRGNSKNLDLNRDFIKQDSREAQSLTRFIAYFQPQLFFDTHTSNGADYPATLTYIETQWNKMNSHRGTWMHESLTPAILQKIPSKYGTVPYVNTLQETPDSGITCFVEGPRFATGFTSVLDIPGYTIETHMLKPFEDRVNATYAFLEAGIQALLDQRDSIPSPHQLCPKQYFLFNWTVDYRKKEELKFTGYEAEMIPSELSGAPRLRYNRSKTWTRKIPNYAYAHATDSDLVPSGFVIPVAWNEVLERIVPLAQALDSSSVKWIQKDSVMLGKMARIVDFQTGKSPYEGHYLHSKMSVQWITQTQSVRAGDCFIQCTASTARLLMETLHPRANDSYFAWGFFDPILQQKEYFSDYVFEDLAVAWLKEHPSLKSEFEAEKLKHPEWVKDGSGALWWVYSHSSYYEKTHKLYPVLFVD
jgi:Zinc carboxypeptidase